MNPTSAYRRAAGQSATAVGRVVLLYEQLITDLRRALAALDKNDIEHRTREIDHALTVVGQLQGTLNMEKGGEVARNLQRFYDYLCANLLQAQMQGSKQILQRQIANLVTLREAWKEVDRAETKPASPPESVASITEADGSTSHEREPGSWRG